MSAWLPVQYCVTRHIAPATCDQWQDADATPKVPTVLTYTVAPGLTCLCASVTSTVSARVLLSLRDFSRIRRPTTAAIGDRS